MHRAFILVQVGGIANPKDDLREDGLSDGLRIVENSADLYTEIVTYSATESRPFQPGTTGWAAEDLDHPEIERGWESGAYEIVEGVLATMAPADYLGGKALFRLMYRITLHAGESAGSFSPEAEIICGADRVARADAVFLTPQEEARQELAARHAGRADPARSRILIPPTLIIECVSPGHELHDHRTKRRWYADFGVPNYWILDPFAQSLRCLVLREGQYIDDAAGEHDQTVLPRLFPELTLSLKELWGAK